MIRYLDFAAVLYFTSILQSGDGYRILAVFPTPSFSHQVVFRGLTLALNKRGHDLFVVTADPVNDPSLTNYTEIDISFGYDTWSHVNFIENRGKMTSLDLFQQVYAGHLDLNDRILSEPDLVKLYAPNSNEKFDLVLTEMLCWPSTYALAKRFDVPMIGITSLAPTLYTSHEIGNPILSRDMTIWELETNSSKRSSFWHRLKNFYTIWSFLYWYRTSYMPGQQAIARKHFGNDVPDLTDLAKNVSLVFVDQQREISHARTYIPKVIEIGGFHISKESKSMSKKLKEILDGAKEGFVYMSLGTNVRSTMMPNETLKQFVTAFSKLPYKVLWKFEDDVLPGKPDNVHIIKRAPQQAVLAHPNLKVFIYQGGVQSTEEAVHHAAPLVALPVAFDQDMQAMKMVSLGVAKKLEITALDAGELYEAITTVATDASYKEKMLNLRSLINDKPQDPMENAMWWIEHVIRHKGAPQLHSSTADEPWYSQQDWDIVAFITALSVTVFGFSIVVLHQSIKLIHYTFKAREIYTKKND